MSSIGFSGDSIQVLLGDDGIAELRFDRKADAINKLDAATVDELQAATRAIAGDDRIQGVLVTSGKDTFIVGADIFEFTSVFSGPAADITARIAGQAAVFTAFSDLPVPIAAALNGLALGGGFEVALAADYRVLADTAVVGLPETGLGIFPGFGGTVRLPRLIGAARALDWIVSGKPQNASAALAAGAVDAVAPAAEVRAKALELLRAAMASGAWRQRRAQRNGPVKDYDAAAVAKIKETVVRNARYYPAPVAVVELIEKAADQSRDEAQKLESEAFGPIAASPTAAALIQLFINDQLLKKKAKGHVRDARRVERIAVLGAGIMGGGIAYTSATRGVPVLMKDITQQALDLGTAEARKLLDKQVASGKMPQQTAERILASITPTLTFDGFDRVDLVIEAIVENLNVKKAVLPEVEQQLAADAVMASNTSSLSITEMATVLRRPQNFAGMHFFNPVPVMPLVEVIRGPQTSDLACSTVAAYALALGKTPIVVKDCPGFLVNRILTAQMVGWMKLIRDGADFEHVDRVMEAWGLPMGPAYLSDVIGIDTATHVFEVISAGYPQRMDLHADNAVALMHRHRRLGQKNGIGFYRYEPDAKGRPAKLHSPEAQQLVATVQPQGRRDFSDEDIVERIMLPMIIEAATALEEQVVETAAEVDMGLILGLGFPRHRGGALKYADTVGLDRIVAACGRHAGLGAGYAPTARMRHMATSGGRFFG